jgi:hypothetical protein
MIPAATAVILAGGEGSRVKSVTGGTVRIACYSHVHS